MYVSAPGRNTVPEDQALKAAFSTRALKWNIYHMNCNGREWSLAVPLLLADVNIDIHKLDYGRLTVFKSII